MVGLGAREDCQRAQVTARCPSWAGRTVNRRPSCDPCRTTAATEQAASQPTLLSPERSAHTGRISEECQGAVQPQRLA